MQLVEQLLLKHGAGMTSAGGNLSSSSIEYSTRLVLLLAVLTTQSDALRDALVDLEAKTERFLIILWTSVDG